MFRTDCHQVSAEHLLLSSPAMPLLPTCPALQALGSFHCVLFQARPLQLPPHTQQSKHITGPRPMPPQALSSFRYVLPQTRPLQPACCPLLKHNKHITGPRPTPLQALGSFRCVLPQTRPLQPACCPLLTHNKHIAGPRPSPPQVLSSFRYVLPQTRPLRLRLAGCFLLVALERCINLAVPLLYKSMVDTLAKAS